MRPRSGQSKGLCGSGPAFPWEKGEQGSRGSRVQGRAGFRVQPLLPVQLHLVDGSLWMHRVAMHPFIQALSCFTGLDSGRSLALLFSHSVFHSEFSFGYFKASKIWLEFGSGPGETPLCSALHRMILSLRMSLGFVLAKQKVTGIKVTISRKVGQNQGQGQPSCK